MPNADWSRADFEQYAVARHGPDGAVLLHPYLKQLLSSLVPARKVIDIGCGAGDWSIMAAKLGADVEAIDLAPEMIERTSAAVKEAQLENAVRSRVADANQLPYPDQSFDVALSFNLGPMLSSEGLLVHFQEMKRVLRSGGTAVLNIPASLGVLFTSGARAYSALCDEAAAAAKSLGSRPTDAAVKATLVQMEEIHRATFIYNEDQIHLVSDESELERGANVWRKISGLVVRNIYHPAVEYQELAQKAGFSIVSSERPCFHSLNELAEFNKERRLLGPEYVGDSPYLVLVLQS